MKAVLGVLGVVCVLSVLIMAAGLAFGFLLHVILPRIELPFAVLIGTLSFGLSIIALCSLASPLGRTIGFGRDSELDGEDEEDDAAESDEAITEVRANRRHIHRPTRPRSARRWISEI